MAQADLQPVRTKEEAKERGRNGGLASGRSRLAKKHGRELVRALLAQRELDPQIVKDLATAYGLPEKDITKEVAMHGRQMEKAIRKGDTNAYKAVQQAAGYQDPDEAGNTATVNIIVTSQTEADKINNIDKLG